MGAGNGHGSDCIVISNHSGHPIDIVLTYETETTTGNKKTHTINPRDSYVVFTNQAEAISWERSK